MDILNYDITKSSVEGVRLALKEPNTETILTHQGPRDKKPREQYLIVAGPMHPETQRVVRAIYERAKKREEQGDEGLGDEEALALRAQDDEFEAKQIAKLVLGGEVFRNGKWTKVTPTLALQVMKIVAFRNQVFSFANAAKNFFKE